MTASTCSKKILFKLARGSINFTLNRNLKISSSIDMANIGDMRKPYLREDQIFDTRDLASKEPYGQFNDWFETAKASPKIEEPNAMCVATATKSGLPSARYLLLKGFGKPTDQDPGGFLFFTNYGSRKGKELEENPNAALVFYWEPIKRSVRIEGAVEKVSQEVSESYFDSRPIGSKIGAAISNQSQVIESRQVLADKEKELKSQHEAGVKIEKPSSWGGYRVLPHTFEFWQGQSTRIHDRIRFRRPGSDDEVIDESLTMKGDEGWLIERLSP